MNSQVIFWLIVLVLTVLVEIFTMGLTSIWFAGGAIVAAIVAWIAGPFWLQLILFVVVSVVLIFLTRPLAVKYFNKERVLTNAESMVGGKGIVTSEIDNLRGIGQVTIRGQEWTARNAEGDYVIPEGAVVTVASISGVKLMVRLDESVADVIPEIRSEAELDPRVMEARAAFTEEPD